MDISEVAAISGSNSAKVTGKRVAEEQASKLGEVVLNHGRSAAADPAINEYRNYGADVANGYLITGHVAEARLLPAILSQFCFSFSKASLTSESSGTFLGS